MSATAATSELAARHTRVPRRPRLVSAELLKLRKRRGLVLSGLALTALPMIVAYTVLLIVHAANPAKHGPAGGLNNLSGSMDVLTTLSGVAAILIGATLGAGDLGSGVFRELVVTGRSRLALFAARIPAGLAVVWALVGAGFAVTASASTVFAGSLQSPGATLLIETAAWLALVSGLDWGRAGLADRRRPALAPDQDAGIDARSAARRCDRAPRAERSVRRRPDRADVGSCGCDRRHSLDCRSSRIRSLADRGTRRVKPTPWLV